MRPRRKHPRVKYSIGTAKIRLRPHLWVDPPPTFAKRNLLTRNCRVILAGKGELGASASLRPPGPRPCPGAQWSQGSVSLDNVCENLI